MSWIMKRPTRVPASTAVRMNRASNRIAKWYQKASRLLPPTAWARICAMPTASVGAPPARDRMLFSPMSLAVWAIISGVMTKPQLEITWAALAAVVPSTAAGEFIAK